MPDPAEADRAPSSPAGALTGRSVVVTGADGSSGSGLAKALAGAGASVVLAGDPRACEPLASDLRRGGGRAAALEASLRSLAEPVGADAVFDEAAAAVGPLTGLVHAATEPSALVARDLVEHDDESWSSVWELSMRAALRCLQAAYRSFAGRGGSIVVVVPTLAMTGAAGLVPLAAAAEGQRLLAKSAARQWGPAGVTVNCLATATPVATRGSVGGPVRDQEGGRARPDDGVALAPRALGRPGDPEGDLGPIAVFLLGEPAPFLTGSTLCADGGLWMAP